VAFRSRLGRLVRGEAAPHFDELAGAYAGEIPQHMRDRLLDTKLAHLQDALRTHGIADGARGLDLGCGQGWYLTAMRARGYRVDGTDYSVGQLRRAAAEPAASGRVVQADAQALPFGDASYDFVYSINAIHHLPDPGAQQRSLQEVVRILRPGGLFLLHEINTRNPLFRWYMGYVFPLLKRIDEGTERWILPTALPEVAGARWLPGETRYFTFLPDSVPGALLPRLAPLERALEQSPLRPLSAHYQACLQKPAQPAAAQASTTHATSPRATPCPGRLVTKGIASLNAECRRAKQPGRRRRAGAAQGAAAGCAGFCRQAW
jgi:SAM-dependent methyltransferase